MKRRFLRWAKRIVLELRRRKDSMVLGLACALMSTHALGVVSPPVLNMSFGAASIPLNGSTTLTFIISNPNAATGLGVYFSNTLPAGLVVSRTNPLISNTCDGLVTLAPGKHYIELSGGVRPLAPSANCTVDVSVTGIAPGVMNTTTNLRWTDATNFSWTDGGTTSAQIVVDTTPTPETPSVPSGLSGRAISPTEVSMRWKQSTSASGAPATFYRIFQAGIPGGTVTSTGATIFGRTPSQTYQFSVSACDSQQNCSLPSTEISLTTFAAGTPSIANFTGLWWNSAESGWGINVNHQGNIAFATIFTYDAAGAPMWLVMSSGIQQGNTTSFTGDLYLANGPAFNAAPFTPITAADLRRVGTLTINFDTSASGTIIYDVDGTAVTKNITEQRFGTNTALCTVTTGNRAALTNYQDLWWNPSEPGWGLNITHQDDTIFATLFTYDLGGKNVWFVMSNGGRHSFDNVYDGELYRARGPAFNALPFKPVTSNDLTNVGTMQVRFTDGENGALTYTVDGITVTKTIKRQTFGTNFPSCIN